MRSTSLLHIVGLSATVLLVGCVARLPDPTLGARDVTLMAQSPQAEHDARLNRVEVADATGEPPGTVVVETKERVLYLVGERGRAIRYAVSVGDESYGWTGTTRIGRKAEWPAWSPPAEMVQRWPHVHAVDGGPKSPLGARALYLHEGIRDTLYRIHGTNEPEKIGLAVSSGCIRMRNIDVIDLFERVPVGARVVVR